ncbi:hypothetical protein OIDMADRAFT_58394 [Oidiodendron maius Zn]|uniref:Clr5 domain-containing protein n=1 Tax=Oidiodendron maius (strain Zn) TaxID=913774 RepID=A0A0C3H2S1_OIDMZ|nr:hypothetical protein OIDMADRAFT_58394 [Oidiodendron maius Zn]
MALKKPNRDIHLYLELHRDWIYDLYSNYGWKLDEIHEALVHHRDPWISASKLRSHMLTWKQKEMPQVWPEPQPPKILDRIAPRPPTISSLNHLSMPTSLTPYQACLNTAIHHSAPAKLMSTSTMGVGMAMSSYPMKQIYSPFYTPTNAENSSHRQQHPMPNCQLDQHRDARNDPSGTPTFQTPRHVFHDYLAPPVNEQSSDDANLEPQMGSICIYCGHVVGGRKCRCGDFG